MSDAGAQLAATVAERQRRLVVPRSFYPKQPATWSPELDGSLLQGQRRFSVFGNIGELIERKRCRSCLRDAAAIDGNLMIRDTDLAPELVRMLSVEAIEL
jgi:hypothetical protein